MQSILAIFRATYIWRHAMGAIFIIPVHGTDPVQLLYAQHLKMQTPKNIFDYYKKKMWE